MNDADLLAIQLTRSDGVAVLAIRGQIDAVTAPRLQESVQRACEMRVPVVLDMALVTFMDSSGVSALVHASAVAGESSGSVRIQSPSEEVRRILSITGLDGMFLWEP